MAFFKRFVKNKSPIEIESRRGENVTCGKIKVKVKSVENKSWSVLGNCKRADLLRGENSTTKIAVYTAVKMAKTGARILNTRVTVRSSVNFPGGKRCFFEKKKPLGSKRR